MDADGQYIDLTLIDGSLLRWDSASASETVTAIPLFQHRDEDHYMRLSAVNDQGQWIQREVLLQVRYANSTLLAPSAQPMQSKQSFVMSRESSVLSAVDDPQMTLNAMATALPYGEEGPSSTTGPENLPYTLHAIELQSGDNRAGHVNTNDYQRCLSVF